MWTIKNGRAFNTKTGAQTMREHKRIKRQQAEARNALTTHERTSLHQKGKCGCTPSGTQLLTEIFTQPAS